jgi:hypothetical protein
MIIYKKEERKLETNEFKACLLKNNSEMRSGVENIIIWYNKIGLEVAVVIIKPFGAF